MRPWLRTLVTAGSTVFLAAAVAGVPAHASDAPNTPDPADAPSRSGIPVPGSLYSYAFDAPTFRNPVPNAAAANPDVQLRLAGSWSRSPHGVRFAGDLDGDQSVGYARPEGGDTLSVPGEDSLGFGARFHFEAPTDGGCFDDSRNLTQIGRFGDGLSQLKLQLSSCERSGSEVYPECRIAGENSGVLDLPVAGTRPLVDGAEYVVSCAKIPVPILDRTIVKLETLRVDTGEKTVDSYPLTNPGRIRSEGHLSVANKYELPAPADNTDQFVGEIGKVSYCSAESAVLLRVCLGLELPERTDLSEPVDSSDLSIPSEPTS